MLWEGDERCTVWPQEQQQYEALFRAEAGSSGLVTGAQAKQLLGRSGLAKPALRAIWDLADVDRDGCLNLGEFVVASHLISRAKAGVPLPRVLPPELAAWAAGADARVRTSGACTTNGVSVAAATPDAGWAGEFGDFAGFSGLRQAAEGATSGDAGFGATSDDFADFGQFQEPEPAPASALAARGNGSLSIGPPAAPPLDLWAVSGSIAPPDAAPLPRSLPSVAAGGMGLDDLFGGGGSNSGGGGTGVHVKQSPSASKAEQFVDLFAESLKPQPKMRELMSPPGLFSAPVACPCVPPSPSCARISLNLCCACARTRMHVCPDTSMDTASTGSTAGATGYGGVGPGMGEPLPTAPQIPGGSHILSPTQDHSAVTAPALNTPAAPSLFDAPIDKQALVYDVFTQLMHSDGILPSPVLHALLSNSHKPVKLATSYCHDQDLCMTFLKCPLWRLPLLLPCRFLIVIAECVLVITCPRL